MSLLYTILVHITWWFLHLVSFFNSKISLFVSGRKGVFKTLKSSISGQDEIIWIHVASLGEFEQGLPIIEQLRAKHPNYKILLTFFSPSGYEVKKNTTAADVVTYLPMDTRRNAERFLSLANPKLALFIKYEIWPNYLKTLSKKEIPTILVSASFKKNQIYFKPFGKFMRNALKNFDHFFVQNERSKALLASIGFDNCTISGDTRFDRVTEILQRDNKLDFMEAFKNGKTCFVAGSSWPEDEKVIIPFVNQTENDVKYVFAPHNIKQGHIESLKDSIQRKTLLYSEIEQHDLSAYDVLIIDTIGLLTKIYSYADIAYVGGGFVTGLHNTLEPAVYGIPVLIGPNYEGFHEAEELVQRKGIQPIINSKDFQSTTQRLLTDNHFRETTGKINADYIAENTGATRVVIAYLNRFL
ncbi:glycosyltransferase N-terminal domain-containing protein [Allomuricauda sp. d1]|uniref:3-deoxy-D-manno-octulosonic acid transferase n=1 Tax=Allomuricauda sp. d1 TaxID=3136725 RepID=UPI0031DDCCE6